MPALARLTPLLRRPPTFLLLAGGALVAALVVGLVAARLTLGSAETPAAPQALQAQIAELSLSSLDVADRDALTAIEIDAATVAVKLTDGRPNSAAALAGIAGIEASANGLRASIPRELRRYIGAQSREAASAVHRGDLPGAVATLRDLQNTLARLRNT